MLLAPGGGFKAPAGPSSLVGRCLSARGSPICSDVVQDRPNLTLAVKKLVRDVSRRLPELSHVKASRVLVVAGEARRNSRATIRPAHFGITRRRAAGAATKPLVRIKGRKILYIITLRPPWFVGSKPEERLLTILHELYHASTRFDGTLHRGRRHSRLPLGRYNRRMRRLLRRYLRQAPPEILAPFAHEGEARVRMWLEGPGSFQDVEYAGRRVYTEQQLYYGVSVMRSRLPWKPGAPRRP
jgi:predicted metallopeptidase